MDKKMDKELREAEMRARFTDAIAQYMEKDIECLIYNDPRCDYEHIWNSAIRSCLDVLDTYMLDEGEIGLNPKVEVFECEDCGDPTQNTSQICDGCAYVKENYVPKTITEVTLKSNPSVTEPAPIPKEISERTEPEPMPKLEDETDEEGNPLVEPEVVDNLSKLMAKQFNPDGTEKS